jgi:hypothetical protein
MSENDSGDQFGSHTTGFDPHEQRIEYLESRHNDLVERHRDLERKYWDLNHELESLKSRYGIYLLMIAGTMVVFLVPLWIGGV